MRTVIDSAVEGDDFFDRERRQMWRRLDSDSLLPDCLAAREIHARLTAPRRVL